MWTPGTAGRWGIPLRFEWENQRKHEESMGKDMISGGFTEKLI